MAVVKLEIWSYANLRSALANLGLLVGFLAGFAIAIGEAGDGRLPPAVVCVLACGFSVGYHLAHSRPGLALGLLWTSLALVVSGVTWYVITTAVLDR
jgi:hypothetical protein